MKLALPDRAKAKDRHWPPLLFIVVLILALLLVWPAASQAGTAAPDVPAAPQVLAPQADGLGPAPAPQDGPPLLLAQRTIQELKDSLGQRPVQPSQPPRQPPISPEQQQALNQAAAGCQQAYINAYERLLAKKHQTVDKAKAKIPYLQSCITQSRAMVAQGRQKKRELEQQLADVREQEQPLQKEINELKARRTQAEEKPAGWNEVNPFARIEEKLKPLELQLGSKKTTETELERKSKLMDDYIKDQLLKMINCEADLPILRDRISAAEKALADKVPKLFEIHKQKRFAEIRQLLENRDLGAMQRCAERGYMDLDDVMRNVFD